jgi:hypothetical protein
MLEILVTAVSERADLFMECMPRLLSNIDVWPWRLIVHEDVRPGSAPGEIAGWLHRARTEGLIADYVHQVTDPAKNYGPAMLWCFEQATQPIVLYTQEDWLVVRTVPVARALGIMEAHGLNHILFHKRKTMRWKHADTPTPWEKVEIQFSVEGEEQPQTLCVSEHWNTQLTLWRVAEALPGLQANQHSPQANAFVARFNHWMNTRAGLDTTTWKDQQLRHERLRTYIWGPVGEPRYIQHLGTDRTTGPIEHTAEKAARR